MNATHRNSFGSRRRAFTVTELVALIVTIAFFGGAVVLPDMLHGHQTSDRVKCANNLKQLGLAIALYSNENRGAYPRTQYKGGATVIPDLTNGGFDSPDPFKANSNVPANNIPAAMFLLLRTEDISANVFNCPSTDGYPDDFGAGRTTNALMRSNFSDLKKNLSYSYANPYPDTAALRSGYKLSNALDPAFAIAADLNPGSSGDSNLLKVTTSSSSADFRNANSRNHGEDGQNVLYADGHVEFQSNPMCGINHDNIYTRNSADAAASQDDLVNSPKDKNDSVLLPVELQ